MSANLGICLVPSASWKGLIDDSIVLIPITDYNLLRETRLECSKNSLSSNAVKLFFDYCVENVHKYGSKINVGVDDFK